MQDVLAHLKTVDVIVVYWAEYSAPEISIRICVVVNKLQLLHWVESTLTYEFQLSVVGMTDQKAWPIMTSLSLGVNST